MPKRPIPIKKAGISQSPTWGDFGNKATRAAEILNRICESVAR